MTRAGLAVIRTGIHGNDRGGVLGNTSSGAARHLPLEGEGISDYLIFTQNTVKSVQKPYGSFDFAQDDPGGTLQVIKRVFMAMTGAECWATPHPALRATFPSKVKASAIILSLRKIQSRAYKNRTDPSTSLRMTRAGLCRLLNGYSWQ